MGNRRNLHPLSPLFKSGTVLLLVLVLFGCSQGRVSQKQIIGSEPQPWVHAQWEGRESANVKPDAPSFSWPLFPETLTTRRIEDVSQLFYNQPQFALASPWGVIDYFRVGPKDAAATILFVPGIPGLAYDFHAPAIYLSRAGFDVIAVSPPGLGYSTRIDETFRYTLDDYARFYRWFIQSMGLQNVYLVVNSYSGVTGPHSLARYGSEDLSIKGLIVFNAVTWGIHTPEYTIPHSEQLIGNALVGPSILKFFSATPGMGIAAEYRKQFRHLAPSSQAFYLREYQRHWQVNAKNSLVLNSDKVCDIHSAVRGQNLTYDGRHEYSAYLSPRLTALSQLPLIYFSAGDDDVVPRLYSIDVYRRLNALSGHPKNMFVPIEGVGHMTMMLKPEAAKVISDEVSRWIEKL